MTFSINNPGSSSNKSTAEKIDILIYEMMLELGIPANLKGYKYLSDAIRIAYDDPKLASRIVDGLYTRIAAENGTTVECVEHAVRTALRRVDRVRDTDILKKYFDRFDCPPPKKFINAITNRLRKMLNSDDDLNRTLHI